MAIDIAGMQRTPDIVGNFQRGQVLGQQQRQLEQQRADQQQLRTLAPQIIAGDPAAFEQAAAISPDAAVQYQTVADSQAQKFRNWFNYTDKALQASRKSPTGDLRAVNAALREGAPFVSRILGRPAPTEWTPDMDAGWEQLRARVATLGAGPQADAKVVGNALVDARGNVVYQGPQRFQTDTGLIEIGPDGVAREVKLGAPAPQAAPPPAQGMIVTNEQGERGRYSIGQDGRPVFIAEGVAPNIEQTIQTDPAAVAAGGVVEGAPQYIGGDGPPAGRPILPKGASAEQERLRLARQAAQNAADANQRAAEASERARVEAERRERFGTIPPGFRVNAEGTALEPVPGGPKPAGAAATEGERKAATLLKRLEGSLSQLNTAVGESPSAASPSVLAESARVLPFVGDAAARGLNSPERQRVEAAQLDILDAALTLGTGAAYTKEQLEGYRQSYFPQINDSDDNIRDKAARLQNVIEAARIAAGRAAPASGGGTGGGRAAPPVGTVQDGYRFKGGNPADPNSWEAL